MTVPRDVQCKITLVVKKYVDKVTVSVFRRAHLAFSSSQPASQPAIAKNAVPVTFTAEKFKRSKSNNLIIANAISALARKCSNYYTFAFYIDFRSLTGVKPLFA